MAEGQGGAAPGGRFERTPAGDLSCQAADSNLHTDHLEAAIRGTRTKVSGSDRRVFPIWTVGRTSGSPNVLDSVAELGVSGARTEAMQGWVVRWEGGGGGAFCWPSDGSGARCPNLAAARSCPASALRKSRWPIAVGSEKPRRADWGRPDLVPHDFCR